MSDSSEMRAATLARLDALHRRISGAVAEMSAADPGVTDPLRGLYITDQHAAAIAGGERSGPIGEARSLAPDELDAWAGDLGIDAVDAELLLIAAAPDLDQRYEQLYGYLHDDITRRRASVGLALRLIGFDPTDPEARRRFGHDAAIIVAGLIEVEEADRPFLTRSLRVPDRVVAALLGDDRSGHRVRVVERPLVANEWVDRLARSVDGGVRLVHVRDRPEGTAAALASSALVRSTGAAVVATVDVGLRDWEAVVADAIRESVLRSAGLVIDSLDTVIAAEPRLVDHLVRIRGPIVLVGRAAWDPDWSQTVPLALDAPALDRDERSTLWSRSLGSLGAGVDAGEATSAFRLGPERIQRAADAALLSATHRGDSLGADDLKWGARQQNSGGLRRLARRIEPVAAWHDIVLERETLEPLHEISARVRHRTLVLDDWRLRRGGDRGDGITALFAGPSGTGKTLAAEVIAHELGVDLHTVDLATVVDKYIGETEKNLDRIFSEAEQVNTVLFFDEADALFGKRSEVRDARDRYANVEVAYLLQRMERFDGLVVLATNLRLNIDDAFSRRLDVSVDFPKPGPAQRKRLWALMLGGGVPVDVDVDVDFLARSFEMTGGTIRNAVVTAAFQAAEHDRRVGMTELIRGVAGEYHKLGRLCVESEFKEWFGVLAPEEEPTPVS